MLNASDITKAVYAAVTADPVFLDLMVERGEVVNENPQMCPWLGIYPRSIDYTPETLGMGPDYWTGTVMVQFVLQVANLESGAAADDDLEAWIEKLVDKMVEDTTIKSTVDMINAVRVTYSYTIEDDETMFFKAAIIEMTLEVSTS